MNRILSLLVVTAIVSVTVSGRGIRPAERNSFYRSLPKPNSVYRRYAYAPKPNSVCRSVGNGYGMGRYARGGVTRGAGGGSLIYEMASKIAHTRLYNLNEFL